jgi:hypothetical protein
MSQRQINVGNLFLEAAKKTLEAKIKNAEAKVNLYLTELWVLENTQRSQKK